MSSITVYTKPNCIYCDRAKQLLKSKGLDYKEIIIGEDIHRDDFLELFPEARTVPQIVTDTEVIGGYVQLVDYMNRKI